MWWKTGRFTVKSSPRVTPILAEVLDVALPDAGFYLWAGIRVRRFGGNPARTWMPGSPGTCRPQYNVTVLPGSYLARESAGFQPGFRTHPHGPGGRNSGNAPKPQQRIVKFSSVPDNLIPYFEVNHHMTQDQAQTAFRPSSMPRGKTAPIFLPKSAPQGSDWTLSSM